MMVTVSKSRFLAGCQCLKRLYLQVHQPELAIQPVRVDEPVTEQGVEVGLLSRQMFPGGIEVDGSNGLDWAVRMTRELVANPEVPAIFEGVFQHQGVLVKTDILLRRKQGRWRLVEVKSTGDLKEHHILDVAIQGYVLSHSGTNLSSAWLAHIYPNYVLVGETIDPRQFFLFHNLTRRSQDLKPTLESMLRSQFHVLAMPNPPDVRVGAHCIDPVTCEFFNHCNPPKPSDYIGYLPGLDAGDMEQLEKIGAKSVHDIPADFELTEFQRRVCTAMQTGQPWFGEDLKKEFASLQYPLYFMDFETE